MGFKNILVPYDNSEHANNALKEAINMASENPETKIHCIVAMAINAFFFNLLGLNINSAIAQNIINKMLIT